MRALVEWCQENNLNISKMKELILDFRKQQRKHAPIHITDNLKVSTHKDSLV
jgi:hypothetical protein